MWYRLGKFITWLGDSVKEELEYNEALMKALIAWPGNIKDDFVEIMVNLAESDNKFIQNTMLPPGHPLRQQKYKDAIDAFNAGIAGEPNPNIPMTEVEEELPIDTNLIKSQMGAAYDEGEEEAVTSEEELLKQTGPTGGLEGTQLAAYLSGVTGKQIQFDEETKQLRYVLDDNGEIELSPRMTPTNAYQAATGSETPVDWLQNPDGSAVLDTLTGQPIPLAFSVGDDLFADGGGIDSFIKDFIKPKATTAMVRELEDWLIDLGLASEDDFADDGLWSDTLEKGLKGLMEFANQNYSHVQPGTDYYNSFLERVPDNFQWTGESDMERVGWALIGQAALDVQERWPGRQKGLREAELARIKSASPMPGFNEMRLQIKYWIEAEGGDASEESIDKYVKQWIADQEGFYDDTVSLYDANELNNQFRYFIKSTGQYIDSKWGQSLMGDIAPGTEVGDSWNDQSVIVDREDKSDITPETGRWTVQGSIVDEYAPTRNAEEQRERQRQLYYAAAGKLG